MAPEPTSTPPHAEARPTRPAHPPAARLRHAVDAAAARPWPWLVAVTVAATVAQLLARPTWLGSWYFARLGVHTLLSPVGLHLYALHPQLQMGPLTFVVCAPFVLLGGAIGRPAAMVMMLLAGLIAVGQMRAVVPPGDRVGDRRWFLVGAVALAGWTELAVRFGHPDDALALVSAAVAVRLLRHDRVELAAVAIGLSVDFKPWALPFAAMLLIAERRRLLRAAVILGIVILGAWAPFFLADPHSVNALRFRIPVSAASTLHLLGVQDRLMPAWCRPAQLLLGAVLAVLAVRRGRWPAVLLVVVAARLLLDPGVRTYYDAGLFLGAVAVDVAAAVPVAAAVVLVLVLGPAYLLTLFPPVIAVARTVALLALPVIALALPCRRSPPGGPGTVAGATRKGGRLRAAGP